MKYKISAGGVVVRKRKSSWEVLLLKDMNGVWTFPKGRIEKDEFPRGAAIREIFEEVGIRNINFLKVLPPIQYLYKRNGLIKKTVHYFLFQYKGTRRLKPQKKEGISDAQWVAIDKAFGSLGYLKTNKPLLEKVQILLTTL